MSINLRWGNEPRGQAPWSRYESHCVGRDEFGFAIDESRRVETGMNYAEIWRRGSEAWHADAGKAGRIEDATGATIFIFD